MVKTLKKVVPKKLVPRSFLASPRLDNALNEAAERDGMTKSQWIRKVIEERLVFEGYNRHTMRPTKKLEEENS